MPGDGWNTFQNTANRSAGRSTSVAFAAPATGPTQCQDCPETTASNVRPVGFQSSNFATSTSNPLRPGQVGHIDQKYFEVTYSSLIYTTLPDSRCQKIQKESVSVLFESLPNL